MQRLCPFRILVLVGWVFVLPTVAQDAAPDCQPSGLAQQAISGKSPSSARAGDCAPETGEQKSLAEMARSVQGKKLAQVQVSPEEAEKILNAVPPTLKFASEDSGLPIRSSVKRRMISRDDLLALMQSRKVSDQEAQRLQATELTLKKFGYVPREFSTGKFVEGMYAESVAGFYDANVKTISLLNWVPPDSQLDVLAHELTHALQDQNFNLVSWQRAARPATAVAARFQVSASEAAPESEARRAVLEGQAMVVLIDHQFLANGMHVRLEFLPGASSALSQYMAMMPIPDTPIVHSAPIFLRDGLAFPYREGLLFELELLGTGGKEMAFKRVFAQPPLNTHEIMEPQAYLRRESLRSPVIPDLSGILAGKYEVIDSGGLGELDIRSLVKQYDTSRLADVIAHGWRGSAFLVVKNKEVPTASATTADVALVHVSTWSSSFTAHKFAEFSAATVSKRYSHATPITSTCSGQNCPVESFQFNTEEGLVSIEHRANNMVLITESFDQDLANTLRAEILKAPPSAQTVSGVSDLTLRYASSPIFSDIRTMWEQWFLAQAVRLSGQ
jgi:hypothetical protein